MILLLKDYFRRYPWGFFLLLLAPLEALTSITSFAGFSAILGPVVFIWQRKNGTLDVLRLLPLSRKALTWTLWACAVLLWPTLYVAAALLCTLILGDASGESSGLMVPLVSGWLTIAWAGFAMVVAVGMPIDAADIKTTWDHVQAQVFGGLWGLCMALGMSGPLFLIPTIRVYPLIAVALGLLALVLSACAVRMQIMPLRGGRGARSSSSAEMGHTFSRFRGAGIGAMIVHMLLSAGGIGVLSLAVVLFIGSLGRGADPSAARFAHAGLVVYLALPLFACYQWPPALRALRALPLCTSTLTLSLLLTSVAIGLAVIMTVAAMAAYLWQIPFTSVMAQVFLLGGLSVTILAVGMRFGLWAIMVSLWIAIGVWPLLQLHAAPESVTLFFAALFATCGGLAIHHLLRHRSEVYRQRWSFFRGKGTRG